MSIQHTRGFTLIELMIVVAIIAILAAIAYPSYSNYAYRARRADAKEMLMRVASAQERYYTNMNKYADIGDLNMGSASEQGHYKITVVRANNDQTYTLTAEAQGVQAADKCKNLTLTNSGSKGFTGAETNGSCW